MLYRNYHLACWDLSSNQEGRQWDWLGEVGYNMATGLRDVGSGRGGGQFMVLPHNRGGMVTSGQLGWCSWVGVRYGAVWRWRGVGGGLVSRTCWRSLRVAGLVFSGVLHWVWGNEVQLWVGGEDSVGQGWTIYSRPYTWTGLSPRLDDKARLMLTDDHSSAFWLWGGMAGPEWSQGLPLWVSVLHTLEFVHSS